MGIYVCTAYTFYTWGPQRRAPQGSRFIYRHIMAAARCAPARRWFSSQAPHDHMWVISDAHTGLYAGLYTGIHTDMDTYLHTYAQVHRLTQTNIQRDV